MSSLIRVVAKFFGSYSFDSSTILLLLLSCQKNSISVYLCKTILIKFMINILIDWLICSKKIKFLTNKFLIFLTFSILENSSLKINEFSRADYGPLKSRFFKFLTVKQQKNLFQDFQILTLYSNKFHHQRYLDSFTILKSSLVLSKTTHQKFMHHQNTFLKSSYKQKLIKSLEKRF